MVAHLLGLCVCVCDLVIRDNSIPMIMCRFCGGVVQQLRVISFICFIIGLSGT